MIGKPYSGKLIVRLDTAASFENCIVHGEIHRVVISKILDSQETKIRVFGTLNDKGEKTSSVHLRHKRFSAENGAALQMAHFVFLSALFARFGRTAARLLWQTPPGARCPRHSSRTSSCLPLSSRFGVSYQIVYECF